MRFLYSDERAAYFHLYFYENSSYIQSDFFQNDLFSTLFTILVLLTFINCFAKILELIYS